MTVREQDPVTAFLHHVLGPDVRNSAVDGVSGALGSARRRWSSMEAARLLGLEERWRATVTERVLLAWLCKAHGTILVVTGEASPTRYHLRAERLQDALGSKCETVTLHGAGHAGPLSHASELAILLADALGARAESR
jgi:pimeloyl-ACP methyl ester carboxylesterase